MVSGQLCQIFHTYAQCLFLLNWVSQHKLTNAVYVISLWRSLGQSESRVVDAYWIVLTNWQSLKLFTHIEKKNRCKHWQINKEKEESGLNLRLASLCHGYIGDRNRWAVLHLLLKHWQRSFMLRLYSLDHIKITFDAYNVPISQNVI